MLFCDTGGTTRHDVEDLAAFVSQLAALGLAARVALQSVPHGLTRNARFDLAPFLTDLRPGAGDRVVLTAAHRLTDERLVELRRLAGEAPLASTMIGAFPSRQAVIGTQAKLSYVLGSDPAVIDLGPDDLGTPVFGVSPLRRGPPPERPRLLLVAPDLEAPGAARALRALALWSGASLAVLTDGESKGAWLDANGPAIPFYHFGEVLPVALAGRVDLCALYAPLASSYRVRCLAADLLAAGAVLVDCSEGHALAADSDAMIPGPPDIAGLAPFLADRVLPNRARLAAQARASRTAERLAPAGLLDALGIRAPEPAPETGPGPRPAAAGTGPRRRAAPSRRLVFMPTNGIGLGHARRCALIADALPAGTAEPVFAAFPGCMGLVKSYGFDVMPLVSRSGLHALSYENDLPNYLRLRALAASARALVFDGGYVFDSVLRTVLERDVAGIWIRRGLWQTSQDNAVALDREKAFARVIVPDEAFDELNRDYSRGEHVRRVGPVVGPPAGGAAARAALRAALAERFGLPFERLVVSLLGAGVAADRGAQIQALAAMLERRADTLHLVVVWPSAVVRPAWFGWRRTRVVKTLRATSLAAAADLLVSAAGYNTFNEVLYGRLPAIFIPQMGPFMDDQRARARAAAERDLAATLEPNELAALDRTVERMLGGEAEGYAARLAAATLPEPGNAAAAGIVAGVCAERGLR